MAEHPALLDADDGRPAEHLPAQHQRHSPIELVLDATVVQRDGQGRGLAGEDPGARFEPAVAHIALQKTGHVVDARRRQRCLADAGVQVHKEDSRRTGGRGAAARHPAMELGKLPAESVG